MHVTTSPVLCLSFQVLHFSSFCEIRSGGSNRACCCETCRNPFLKVRVTEIKTRLICSITADKTRQSTLQSCRFVCEIYRRRSSYVIRRNRPACCSRVTSREGLLSHVGRAGAPREGLMCGVRSTWAGFSTLWLAGVGDLPPLLCLSLLQKSIWRQFGCCGGRVCVL